MGPLTLDALKHAGISPATMVWNNTLPDWVEARSLPELADIFITGPAPAPAFSPKQEVPYQQMGGGINGQVRPPMPDNYLVWAILSTALCCLPLGIVSIINATKVTSAYQLGDYDGAKKASDDAKKWAIWSAVSAGIVWVIYIIFIVVLGGIGMLSELS
jgi:hypothetical protein